MSATVKVTNTGVVAGDTVAEAYLKTPQPDGPLHSLVGFQRIHLAPGESREISMTIDPRALSSVDNQGQRSVLAGNYLLSIGAAQPGETSAKSEAKFTISGTANLPR